MGVDFDSFAASGADAFIESPLSARQSAIGDKLLVWPGGHMEGAGNPENLTTLTGFMLEQIAPQWDRDDTWSGNVNDYRAIICNGHWGNWIFWTGVTKPSWYDAVRNGEWTGRIQLGAFRARDISGAPRYNPRATPVREFLNPLAESFGMTITERVYADSTRPYTGASPASDHPLVDDVTTVGYSNFDGAFFRGTPAIDGEGASLVNIGVAGAPSAARVVDRTFPNGNKISMVVSDASLGQGGDPGSAQYRWFESSRQLGRNFWNVPL